MMLNQEGAIFCCEKKRKKKKKRTFGNYNKNFVQRFSE
jgi:hypothetical protein